MPYNTLPLWEKSSSAFVILNLWLYLEAVFDLTHSPVARVELFADRASKKSK